MRKNPNWLNASKFAPQFHKHPVTRTPDKAVCLQNFTEGATTEQLKAAGVTHVWQNVKEGRLSDSIGSCQNYSTAMFGSNSPSEATVRAAANSLPLDGGMIITDEFAEGSFPQADAMQTAFWFYHQLEQRDPSIRGFGEYGRDGMHLYQNWKRVHDQPRDPMSQYFLSLLGNNIIDVIDNTIFKTYYTSGANTQRGKALNYYYDYSKGPVGDWVSTIPVQAMYNYNKGNEEVMLFTWNRMQTTLSIVDTPERNAPTKQPGGSTINSFPALPAEISKIHGFLGCLLFESVYLWSDNGVQPDNDNAPGLNFPALSTDAFFVGVDWYTQLIPVLNQAGRALYCADYTSNGTRLTYNGGERLISRRNSPHYNNSYFNQT